MTTRKDMYTNCKKVTIGKDFAVFEFSNKEDVKKSMDFAETCNGLYNYTFDSNGEDKLVCFQPLK